MAVVGPVMERPNRGRRTFGGLRRRATRATASRSVAEGAECYIVLPLLAMGAAAVRRFDSRLRPGAARRAFESLEALPAGNVAGSPALSMKLAMTLLARDEADIVDAQISFHLHAGVDVVVATDNRSEDGTTEIFERYERDGVLHLLSEDGDDLRQSEWVTRMARLAATELGADWVLNADADEFWWPRARSAEGPACGDPCALRRRARRLAQLRASARRRPFFAERMIVAAVHPELPSAPAQHPFKSVASRDAADIRIGRGNHEALADDLVALRGWYPIEILHFPVRSL